MVVVGVLIEVVVLVGCCGCLFWDVVWSLCLLMRLFVLNVLSWVCCVDLCVISLWLFLDTCVLFWLVLTFCLFGVYYML